MQWLAAFGCTGTPGKVAQWRTLSPRTVRCCSQWRPTSGFPWIVSSTSRSRIPRQARVVTRGTSILAGHFFRPSAERGYLASSLNGVPRAAGASARR